MGLNCWCPGGRPVECKEPVMPKGTWKTTSGGGGTAAAVVVTGALAYVALRSFAAMLGNVAAIAVTAAIAVSVGAGVTLLAVRVRGHRRAGTAQQPVPAITAAFDREHAIRAAGTRQAITPPRGAGNHFHGPSIHFHGPSEQDMAAAVRALSGQAGDIITKEQ